MCHRCSFSVPFSFLWLEKMVCAHLLSLIACVEGVGRGAYINIQPEVQRLLMTSLKCTCAK